MGSTDGSEYHKEALRNLKDPSLFIQNAFIDGEWVSKDKKFDVYEPSTGTVLGQVADGSLEDFQKAIQSANEAQPKFFAETTATQRGALLRKWYDLIVKHQEDSRRAPFLRFPP
ncbi:Aldehyde/histidinol dehydrogenase [Annulohypoxylon truncatum]|uniref:Aldehyde/histidinol dehydrogenase n=1 Tax=Annulohypoxylon truncatum TaxID=327061 RepID=UPI0020072EBB|nr:Aldehyde/histidinol dehydrogenase [Annulohypoxylon truncatum]KAI1213737.1 Aldehyde/histidinol dehydrogenase [Annulohypoxylon truncatum]